MGVPLETGRGPQHGEPDQQHDEEFLRVGHGVPQVPRRDIYESQRGHERHHGGAHDFFRVSAQPVQSIAHGVPNDMREARLLLHLSQILKGGLEYVLPDLLDPFVIDRLASVLENLDLLGRQVGDGHALGLQLLV